MPVSRPRIRTADDERELPVASYEYFADRDPLTRAVMDRMLAGVSTRKYAGRRRAGRRGGRAGQHLDVEEARCRSRSLSGPETALSELMGRRLDDVRLAVMMLDGLEIADRTHVVALGISTEGVKIPLGLWEGSTENATLVSDAARRPRRPRARSRPGDPVRDRRRARRCARRSTTCSVSTRSCTAVTGTRSETSPICCPSATAPQSSSGSAARGPSLTTHLARGATRAARLRARSHMARRRRVAPGGDGRHADTHAARDRQTSSQRRCAQRTRASR